MHPAIIIPPSASRLSPSARLDATLRWIAAVGVMVPSLLLSSVPARAEEPGRNGESGSTAIKPSPPPNPPGLSQAIEAITRTFRQQKPPEMSGVLPENGKVFLSLRSLGGGAGYFGRGQVHFILTRIFGRRETVRFAVSARGERGEPRDDGPTLVWCVGIWSFRQTDGMDDERQIHFILTCQKGQCHVMEIREAR